jgi:hypothetical protein
LTKDLLVKNVNVLFRRRVMNIVAIVRDAKRGGGRGPVVVQERMYPRAEGAGHAAVVVAAASK